jgi:hypothetical protein
MSDEQGLENCAKGLQRLLPLCEKLGVTLVMELLNSKVNHADYMCDHSAWGVSLVKKLASPHFKLLYDIYHMQIMEGDVIATIRRDHESFAHYHTGGVPGRAEIDETQELNYPAIIKAIQETGYTGYLGQEFIPKRPDKLASLKQGVQICTVGSMSILCLPHFSRTAPVRVSVTPVFFAFRIFRRGQHSRITKNFDQRPQFGFISGNDACQGFGQARRPRVGRQVANGCQKLFE